MQLISIFWCHSIRRHTISTYCFCAIQIQAIKWIAHSKSMPFGWLRCLTMILYSHFVARISIKQHTHQHRRTHTHTPTQTGEISAAHLLTDSVLKYRYLRLNCRLDTGYFKFLGTCYMKRTYSIQLFLLFCHCRPIYSVHRHLSITLQAIRPLFGIELLRSWCFVLFKMKTICPQNWLNLHASTL